MKYTFLLLLNTCFGVETAEAATTPKILSAVVNFSTNQISIIGQNFSSSGLFRCRQNKGVLRYDEKATAGLPGSGIATRR